MPRLPTVGGDDKVWGNILNEFLSVEHNPNGTLKSTGSLGSKADDDKVVHNTGNESISGIKNFATSPVVPTPVANNQVANKSYVDTVAAMYGPDATTADKGLVRLSGDLGGTADAPTVPGLDQKINKSDYTTKGDLLAATAASTPARLGAGSDGQVLTADSSEPTGLKWAESGTDAVKKGDLFYNIKDYGAVGDGAADDTAAINSAIAAAESANGGIIYAPAGNYRLTGPVYFQPNGDTGLDLLGAGMWATVFSLGDANARIQFSDGGASTSVGQRGSKSGEFSVHGNNVATVGVMVGLTDDREFSNIFIKDVDGVGFLIELAQNLVVSNLYVSACDIGMKLDYGAGGNVFHGIELNESRINLMFTASGNTPGVTSYSGIPFDNKFFGGILEQQGNLDTETHLHYGAGQQNYFFGTHFANSQLGPGQQTPMVKIRTDNTEIGPPSTLHLIGCWMQGNVDGSSQPHGYAIDANVDGSITYVSDCAFGNLDALWVLSDSHRIEVTGGYTTVNITQRFRNQPGGGNFEQNLVRSRPVHPIEHYGASSDEMAYLLSAQNETGFRYKQTVDGAMIWGNGTDFSGDTSLYRAGSQHLMTNGSFEASQQLRAGFVNLTNTGQNDTTAGGEVGDKVALHGAGYGIGVQAGRMVFYVPNGNGVAVRTASDDGARSSNPDSIQLYAHEANSSIVFNQDNNAALTRSDVGTIKTPGKLIASGGLGVGNSAAASTQGTLVRKIEVFDADGVSLGFIPVYDSIS